MAGIISKLKNAATSQKPPPMEANPIMQYFDVGNECSTAGPGLAWKVYDAQRKSDNKECSVFVLEKALAEKIYKPTKQKKDKDLMIDCIRNTVLTLDRVRHPKMLQVIHSLEEGATTIAFATEPILASLHDILTWQENNPKPNKTPPVQPMRTCYSPPPLVGEDKADEPPKVKNYWFLEMEVRYGLLQIIDALHYLHYTARQVHRNVSPHVILVCKRGTWKLFGLDFVENIVSEDPTDMINVPPYNIKISKIAQPHLDYMAPEAQINGQCNILSDMFSLGLVLCTVFNHGKPLVQAGCNPMSYIKQVEHLSEQLHMVMSRIPDPLQEAVSRLLSKDPHPRPTTQLLPLIKYFKCNLDRCYSEPAINALQYLDVITTKDENQRSHFYKVTLMESLPHIPEKLVWIHVWPGLQQEVKTGEVVAAVLVPIIWLCEKATQAEFDDQILPTLKQIYCRNLVTNSKCALASITFLENMHIILDKANSDEVYSEIVPLMITALDNNTNVMQQTAALVALQNCADQLDDMVLHTYVLSKVKTLLERNSCDVKIVNLILCFYEKVIYRLEKVHLVEHVIPTMLLMKLHDPDIISRVVKLYKIMITDKKFGLTSTIMAQKMLPVLAPQTVNPGLTVEQYHALIEILYELLDHIDAIQRNVVGTSQATGVPRIERPSRPLRHRYSTDYIGEAPPFSIPNLRVERERKASSAEDMARKASVAGPSIQPTPSQSSVGTGIKKIGQWFFGSNNSTNSNNNNDNNFLRVASNVFPNRRLSDNTMLNPRVRVSGAPSSASSPGGSPGGSAGLPTRRHSSIGPQERRGSHLSPPPAYQNRGRGGSGSSLSVPATAHTAGGSMPNASTSVPQLGASNASVATGPGSRRPSGASRRPSNASHVSHLSHMSRTSQASARSNTAAGLMQQIQTGVVRLLPNVPPRPLRATPPGATPLGATPLGATPPDATPSCATPPGAASPRPGSSRGRRSSGASQWLQNAISSGNRTLQKTIRKVPSLRSTFQR